MTAVANPALQMFAAQIRDELILAQVLITRVDRGYELRHVADRMSARETLRVVPLAELRKLAELTERGAYRPLKSAPNLRSGWCALAGNDKELGEVLARLYPGAVADWFAAQSQHPPITGYRQFTDRQTGMYRITTMLDDGQAAQMIGACCNARFCLKRRLWTVAGLRPDQPDEKSLVPCLEPCAVLLEFARKAMRLEQDEKLPPMLSQGEVETLCSALETALRDPALTDREADFNEASNPRRLQLTLEKLKAWSGSKKEEPPS